MLGVPAIIIRDHGDRGVADFGFAREFCFGDVGHADYFKAQLAVDVGFGERGKLWTFHADIRAAAMHAHFGAVTGFAEHGGELSADGFREAYVRGHAVSEKSGDTVARAIVELIGNQKIQGLQIFLERTDGADRDDSLDAELLHGMNVGAIIYFRGEETVPARMACEKRHTLRFECPDDERVGRVAEGSLHAQFARVFEARHGVEAAAANDADAYRFGTRTARFFLGLRFVHECPL